MIQSVQRELDLLELLLKYSLISNHIVKYILQN